MKVEGPAKFIRLSESLKPGDFAVINTVGDGTTKHYFWLLIATDDFKLCSDGRNVEGLSILTNDPQGPKDKPTHYVVRSMDVLIKGETIDVDGYETGRILVVQVNGAKVL